MASIASPRISLFQVYLAQNTQLLTNLRPLILGPEYLLHRADVAEEDVASGTYNPQVNVTYTWAQLGMLAGSTVDQAYTGVLVKGATFQYLTGNGVSSFAGSDYKLNFGVNIKATAGTALDAVFAGRDVADGDSITVSGVVGGVNYSGTGTIVSFEAIPTASSIGTATADVLNSQGSTAAGPVIAAVSGTGATHVVTVGGAYDGTDVGVVSETYTIQVARGTSGLNPSTGVFTITSASGQDSIAGFVPSATAFGTAIQLGNNGLTFTIGGAADLITGQAWTVTASMTYSAPTIASGTTHTVVGSQAYTGAVSTTYVVTVVKGGDIASANAAFRPIVAVSTTDGSDNTLPMIVAQNAASIVVGHYGVKLVLSGETLLLKGDRFYIPATSSASGAVRIAVLDKAIPAQLVGVANLSYALSVVADVQLPASITSIGETNWSTNAQGITLHAGASAFTSAWHDGQVPLPLTGGELHFTWRELVVSNAQSVQSMSPGQSVVDVLATQAGTTDNPLGFALGMCGANTANGGSVQVGIKFVGVKSDDIAGYSAALKLLTNVNDAYFIVPLTYDRATLDLVTAHIAAMSGPVIGRWRIGFYPSKHNPIVSLVKNSATGGNVKATTNAQNVLTSQTIGVNFIESGVRAGDNVRLAFSTNPDGTQTYVSHQVQAVLGATQLLLLTAPTAVITAASKFEIWRTQNSKDLVADLSSQAAHYNSRRIALFYPDQAPVNGVPVPSYYLAAAVAGIAASVPPQQGLSTLGISGFDSLRLVNDRFSSDELDQLAGNGLFLCWQDLDSNAPAIRHQLMTLTDTLLDRELSCVKNIDSLYYYFDAKLKPYRGRTNVTQGTLDAIRSDMLGAFSTLESTTNVSPLIGGQLIPGSKITQLRQDRVNLDTIVVNLALSVPVPTNYGDITLALSAGSVTLS